MSDYEEKGYDDLREELEWRDDGDVWPSQRDLAKALLKREHALHRRIAALEETVRMLYLKTRKL